MIAAGSSLDGRRAARQNGRMAKKKINMRCVNSIPRKLTKARVLVHNHVIPQSIVGLNGFRAWTQTLTADLEVCSCDWAGVDLGGLIHYRVKPEVAAKAGKSPNDCGEWKEVLSVEGLMSPELVPIAGGPDVLPNPIPAPDPEPPKPDPAPEPSPVPPVPEPAPAFAINKAHAASNNFLL